MQQVASWVPKELKTEVARLPFAKRREIEAVYAEHADSRGRRHWEIVNQPPLKGSRKHPWG